MKLDAREIPATDATLAQFLSRAELPTSDLDRSGQLYFAFEKAGVPVGFGGMMLAGGQALLRSIVVDETKRGSGLGASIVERLAQEADSRGAKTLWLLTSGADEFFARLGFNHAARSDAPSEIAATPQFSGICPGSAAFMRRDVKGGPDVSL